MVGRWNFLWGPGLFSGANCWFQGGYMRIYFWGCHFFLISGTIWLPFICQIPLTTWFFHQQWVRLCPWKIWKPILSFTILSAPLAVEFFGCPVIFQLAAVQPVKPKNKGVYTPLCDGNPPFPQEKTAVHRLRSQVLRSKEFEGAWHQHCKPRGSSIYQTSWMSQEVRISERINGL